MRTTRYVIYDSVLDTANLVGEWQDASAPSFSVSAGRYSDISVRVPRRLGRLDEPNEEGSTGTVRHGFRLDVYAASEFTLSQPATAGAYDTLIYRGTIEAYKTTPTGTDIKVVALHRLAEQANVPAPDAASDVWVAGPNFVADTAQDLVETFLGTNLSSVGVVWDPSNPVGVSGDTSRGSGTTATVIDFQLTKGNVAGGLDDLIRLNGRDWLWYVTPESKIRFFKANTSVVNHYLTVGVDVTDYDLSKDFAGAVMKVTVTYADGGKYTATHADYTAADPRWQRIDAPNLDATAAQQLAEETLADLGRVRLTGSITVSGERYPIERIRLGDTVQLHTDSPLPTDTAREGYHSYDAEVLVISGIDYRHTEATLHLTQPARGAVQTIKQLKDELNYGRGLLMPLHQSLTRPPVGTTVGIGGGASAMPTPAGYASVTFHGTRYVIPYFNHP